MNLNTILFLEIWWLIWYSVFLGVSNKTDINAIGCLLGVSFKFALDMVCSYFQRTLDNKQLIEFQMVGINILIFIVVFEIIYPIQFNDNFEMYSFIVAASFYALSQAHIYRQIYHRVKLLK